MSNYLIELSIIHMALMLGYWFFLRKERQYVHMRSYLVIATLMALIIPLFKLPRLISGGSDPVKVTPMESLPIEPIVTTPAPESSFWSLELLFWVYLAISACFLINFLINVLRLVILAGDSDPEQIDHLSIRKVRNLKGSFTFFNWIFLSDEMYKDRKNYAAILSHEEAHRLLRHSYDLVFFELFKACFWFLPSAWFIRKEIKKIHEFQADAHVLRSYDVDDYSTILIESNLKTNGLSLASSFHNGIIFKRLREMRQQEKNVSPWKFGMLTMLVAILFIGFACTEDPAQNANSEQEELFTVVEEQPQFEGGMSAFYTYVANNIRYPKEARTSGVEGRAFIQFTVERDGSVSEVMAVKGIGAGCEDEAVKVLESSPSFKPARQRGRAVRVKMIIPVTFKINGDVKNPDNTPAGIVIVDEVQFVNLKMNVEATYTNGEWRGTVFDENGDELPGVNIVIPGTTSGTVSDLDGTFKIKSNESEGLFVSFVGYESVELKANQDL